jgi:hypothetical protein
MMRALGTTIVDWSAIGQVVLYSTAAGLGVAVAFGVAIRGTVRFAEMRRDGRGPEAAVFAILAVAGLALSGAAVGYGIYLMAQR